MVSCDWSRMSKKGSKMKKFLVRIERSGLAVFEHEVEVDAENRDEAIDIALDNLTEDNLAFEDFDCQHSDIEVKEKS